MDRKVFFSFHYERDILRAIAVKNSWANQLNKQSIIFWDRSFCMSDIKSHPATIRRMIDTGLHGTSVTVVLIGKETYKCPWVRYELQQSLERGNSLLGVLIHGICDPITLRHDKIGDVAFGPLGEEGPNENKVYFSQRCRLYDWKLDKGYENIAKWIEKAFKEA